MGHNHSFEELNIIEIKLYTFRVKSPRLVSRYYVEMKYVYFSFNFLIDAVYENSLSYMLSTFYIKFLVGWHVLKLLFLTDFNGH